MMAGSFSFFDPQLENDDLSEDLADIHQQLLAEGALARAHRPSLLPLIQAIDTLEAGSLPHTLQGATMNDISPIPPILHAAKRTRLMGIGSFAAVVLVALLALLVFQLFHGKTGSNQAPSTTSHPSSTATTPRGKGLGSVTVKGITFTVDHIYANATHTELKVYADGGMHPECAVAACQGPNLLLTDALGNQVFCFSGPDYSPTKNGIDDIAECNPLPAQDLGHTVALTVRVNGMGDSRSPEHYIIGTWQLTVTTTTIASAYQAVPLAAPITHEGITIRPTFVMVAVDDGQNSEFTNGGFYLRLHVDGTNSPYVACIGSFNFTFREADGSGGGSVGTQSANVSVTLPGAQPVLPSQVNPIAQKCPAPGGGVVDENVLYFMPLKAVPNQIIVTVHPFDLVDAASHNHVLPDTWTFTIPLH